MITSSSDIIKENSAWLESDKECSDILYRAVLSELAKRLCNTDGLPSPSDALEAFYSAGLKETAHFTQLCEILTAGHTDHRFSDSDLPPKRVSYLRSPMTDKAFMVFSEMFPGLSAVYGADFKSICEDVYYERSDACILPLESSSDGLLMSFRKLLMKYELYIHSVSEQRQNDDSVITLSLLSSSPSFKGDNFELYLPSSPLGTTETVCMAVSALGGAVTRISTLASEYSSGLDIHLCVNITAEKSCALLYCIEALCPSHMIIGNY